MTLFGWIYLTLLLYGTIFKIIAVEKPQKPVTGLEAALTVLLNIGLFLGLYYWGVAA